MRLWSTPHAESLGRTPEVKRERRGQTAREPSGLAAVRGTFARGFSDFAKAIRTVRLAAAG